MKLVELNKGFKELKFGDTSFYNSLILKEWVWYIKYFGRKEYGSVWFKQMLNQMEIKEDRGKYPDSIYFFIGDEVVMEQNEKYERLWVHYVIIWSFFYSEFGYNYQETSDLIRGMVEEHFKMRSFPTPPVSLTLPKRWKNISK